MSEFKDRLRDQPIKVNKLNAQEVRLTLDELVADYFVEEARYSPIDTVINGKLISGAVLALIGCATAIYSYITPFDDCKWTAAFGAASYLFVALIAYVWTTYGVAPTCFRGIPPAQPITKSTKSSAIGSVTSSSSKDKLNKDNAIWIASKMLMPQAIYRLAILDPNPPSAGCLSFWLGGHNSTELVSHSWHFGRWIRSDGEISIDAFCEDMDIFLSSQVSSAIEKYTK